MGHSDPFALQVVAYAPTSPTLYHVYEFTKPKMFARTIAELLLGPGLDTQDAVEAAHARPRGIFKITGYPDAFDADMSGLGGAVLDELASVYQIRAQKAEQKQKFDAIEITNGDFVDGRIKILKGSELEKQLMHLQWVADEYGRLKEKRGDRNDASDAFVYARRRAMHLFQESLPEAKPRRGSLAARELEAKAEEDRAAKAPDEFENYLGDDSFDRFFD